MAAAFAAFLGLIPPFFSMFRQRPTQNRPEEVTSEKVQISEAEPRPDSAKKLSDFPQGRAIILTGMATAIGVMELIVFSARLIPLTQVCLYIVSAEFGIERSSCEDCLA
jgi:hypothetical protein